MKTLAALKLLALCFCTFLFVAGCGGGSQAVDTYLFTDNAGSVVVTTNDQGEVITRTGYTPFGDAINYDGDIEPELPYTPSIGYAGHYYDTDLDLIYMGERWYDPKMGRFLSVDPVDMRDFIEGNPHMFNRYAYANNNPYSVVDPNGDIPFLIPVAIFLAKELAAEGLSQATGGATDFLSVRRVATKAARKGAEIVTKGAGGKADFIVSPKGTTMPTNKDFNLVDSNKKNGEWFQIHNKHTDAKVDGSPHTHYPKRHDRNTTREIKRTDGADLDHADNALRNGTMRERRNRSDRGG